MKKNKKVALICAFIALLVPLSIFFNKGRGGTEKIEYDRFDTVRESIAKVYPDLSSDEIRELFYTKNGNIRYFLPDNFLDYHLSVISEAMSVKLDSENTLESVSIEGKAEEISEEMAKFLAKPEVQEFFHRNDNQFNENFERFVEEPLRNVKEERSRAK